ncbi:MAG TPA: hypothetical protein VI522_06015, partial [Gammaproteobacteria bacterium]|nr:hypothetical protein [Gammaproteobacteria bacterium]
FLGETKHKFYDLALKSYGSDYDKTSTDSAIRAMVQTTNSLHSFRENFRIGRGPNKGNINLLAFLNPFNYARAFDNYFINNGLRMIAFARNANDQLEDDMKWGIIPRAIMGLIGIGLCTVGAIFRVPRVLVQYAVGATTKPLWNLYKEYKTNPNITINWWRALPIAIFFTLINAVIIGLSFGAAAPATTYVSNAASQIIADAAAKTTSTITAQAVSEVVVRPVSQALNQTALSHIPGNQFPFAAAYPGTDAVVGAALAGAVTSAPQRMLMNGGYLSTAVATKGHNDDQYVDYGYDAPKMRS